jgi:hypothetical protein
MATTTPNFGWSVPTSTDLVKDGATAIETLGDSIDASLVDLKGGTTGQVLAKATNTDMDFSWVAQDDSNAIQNAIVDAKGDVITATANDTPARLAVGANGTVLTADSTAATGLKWATSSSGPTGYTLLNAGGTTLVGSSTVTISSISAKKLLIFFDGMSSATVSTGFRLRINGDSAANYSAYGQFNNPQATYTQNIFQGDGYYSLGTGFSLGSMGTVAGDFVFAAVSMDLTDTTGWKNVWINGAASTTGNNSISYNQQGLYEASAAVTSVTVLTSNATNFDAGTIYVLGAN